MLAALAAGCNADDKLIAYQKLRALPDAELEQKFIDLPPKEQVDLYTTAISQVRPADTRLAPVLAKQGTKVLPALVEKLEAADKGVPPQPLVLVIYMMANAYHVEDARALAPRVAGWCDCFYEKDSYCHEMGGDLMKR
ncbi:hypothetical protein [Roseateles sp.]|uniref:hypothetical protein n=1 Tax=Roseateles sp. TaxID=1971397 RepID=UPI002E000C37|nr:hypothetical protein [Roseateles sp.]